MRRSATKVCILAVLLAVAAEAGQADHRFELANARLAATVEVVDGHLARETLRGAGTPQPRGLVTDRLLGRGGVDRLAGAAGR